MEGTGNVNDVVMARLKARGEAGRVAVVGASNNPEKYGNKIVRNLLQKGYEVVPINPAEETIEGLKAYPSLAAVDVPVGIVNFVVPPKVTRQVLEGVRDRDFGAVWFQDGSFNDDVIEYAEAHFQNVVHHACIMVVTNFV
jgi:predicted CoA-binding protein